MTDTQKQKIKSLLEQFGDNEIWEENYFNKGIYDGLEIAISILEDRNPNCRVYGNDVEK